MHEPFDCCQVTLEIRDFPMDEEVGSDMNARTQLTPDERQRLACQTGQLLVAIGSLLTSQSTVRAHLTGRTGDNLMALGRKLLSAGKCAADF